MPRTTLLLDDDAMRTAKAYAERLDISLGEAVSELVRRGVDRPLLVDDRNGFPVVRLPAGSPKVTAAAIARALEDIP